MNNQVDFIEKQFNLMLIVLFSLDFYLLKSNNMTYLRYSFSLWGISSFLNPDIKVNENSSELTVLKENNITFISMSSFINNFHGPVVKIDQNSKSSTIQITSLKFLNYILMINFFYLVFTGPW